MKRSNVLTAVIAVALIAGCSPTNSQLGNSPIAEPAPTPAPKPTPPPPPDRCTAQGGSVELEYAPKVDIIFVIDNSTSMDPHQATLASNINRFVTELSGESKALDFKIGILAAWDSQSYGTADAPKNREIRGPHPKGLPVIPEYGQGEFRELKVCKNSSCAIVKEIGRREGYEKAGYEISSDNGRLVTKNTPEFTKVLADSLKLGTLWADHWYENPLAYGGPEYEEVLSPISAAINNLKGSSNEHSFPRKGVPLFIFILTDANDSSQISANQLWQQLLELKDNNANQLGIAVVMANPRGQGASCKGDDSGEKGKIEAFHDMFPEKNRMMMNLCTDGWGNQLAQVGEMIRVRSSAKIIPLNCTPDVNTIKVNYGSVIIPRHDVRGWSYDPNRGGIVINPGVRLQPIPGQSFTVDSASSKK